MKTRALALCAVLALGASFLSRPVLAAKGDITLLGSTTLTGQSNVADVWGYVDWYTGKEYAVVGNWQAPARVWIVDVTNPNLPTEVSYISGASGFDVKAWRHYVYTCDGDHLFNDSRIIDIADPANPVLLPNGFRSAHNIAVDPAGKLFLDVSGFSIWDIATDPTHPDSLWISANVNGHDATPIGDNKVWDFAGWDGFARLYDYSNPSNPTQLSNIANPSINYYHSGDVTEDGNYLFICDELAGGLQPDLWVYDISDLGSPAFETSFNIAGATIHNLYVVGDIAFVSYYNAGFVTMDVSAPGGGVTMFDDYDTNVRTGDGWDYGAWGVYPFLPSGNVLVTDQENGLFVFGVEGYTGPVSSVGETPAASGLVLRQNHPNPFHPSTTIGFELDRAENVELSVYDVAGRLVRTLVAERRGAGPHQVSWDGTNRTGQRVASGVYVYRLKSGRAEVTRRMVLLH